MREAFKAILDMSLERFKELVPKEFIDPALVEILGISLERFKELVPKEFKDTVLVEILETSLERFKVFVLKESIELINVGELTGEFRLKVLVPVTNVLTSIPEIRGLPTEALKVTIICPFSTTVLNVLSTAVNFGAVASKSKLVNTSVPLIPTENTL